MHSTTWFRRAAWPLVLGIIMTAGNTACGQDDGAPPDGPPPRRQLPPLGDIPGPPGRPHERIRTIVRRVEPGYQLKMAVSPVPKALDAQLNLEGQGVLVTHVQKDGPADKAGIKAYDILLAAEDKPLKGPRDLLKAAEQSEGKELTLKLRRAGEEMSVTVAPEKAHAEAGVVEEDVRVDFRKLNEIERTIREKVKDAGVDMRLQFIQPGTWLPRGVDFAFDRHTELPDDLSIDIHKQGKKPADIEVTKGEQTWTVKEDDLAPLPDEVRRDVEGFLGRGPMQFSVVGPGGFGDHHHQRGPRPPRGPHDAPTPWPGGLGGPPERPHPPRGDEAGPGGHRFRGPDDHGPHGPRDRVRDALERQLDIMSRQMHEMQDRLDHLQRYLHDDVERPERPRRPERPEPPEEESEEDDA